MRTGSLEPAEESNEVDAAPPGGDADVAHGMAVLGLRPAGNNLKHLEVAAPGECSQLTQKLCE